jgi:hypothetical protein
LSTDCEGFDQFVANGARGILSAGRVGVYQFEMYRQDDYKAVFERLWGWGYRCYFFTEKRKGKKRPVPWLVRITGCWLPQYEGISGWVNALCYNVKVPELVRIFSALERRKHTNTGPSKIVQRRLVSAFLAKYVNVTRGTGY